MLRLPYDVADLSALGAPLRRLPAWPSPLPLGHRPHLLGILDISSPSSSRLPGREQCIWSVWFRALSNLNQIDIFFGLLPFDMITSSYSLSIRFRNCLIYCTPSGLFKNDCVRNQAFKASGLSNISNLSFIS